MRGLFLDVLDFHDPGSIARRAHLLRALDHWVDEAPSAVLDYGCGTGRHSFLVATRWPSARVVGLDVDEKALAAARQRAAKRAPGRVSFFPEGSFPRQRDLFDLAICIDVLEHIPDDLGALRRMAYLMKEGGLLILHAPALGQKHYWGVEGGDAGHAGGEEFGHVRRGYDEEGLGRLLRSAGFVPKGFGRTVGKALAWLTDLDYRLSRWGLLPLRAVTYLAAKGAARMELGRWRPAGRGIMAVARRAGGRRL